MDIDCANTCADLVLDDAESDFGKTDRSIHVRPVVETAFGKDLIELFMPEFYDTKEVEHLAYGYVVKTHFYDVEFCDLGDFDTYLQNLEKNFVYELKNDEEIYFRL